jgi:hypothetical protein
MATRDTPGQRSALKWKKLGFENELYEKPKTNRSVSPNEGRWCWPKNYLKNPNLKKKWPDLPHKFLETRSQKTTNVKKFSFKTGEKEQGGK